jgi:hypothetical protein
MEYYLALEKKEALTHTTTWISLEDLMLSEISQAQKDKTSYICIYITYLNSHIHQDR